MHKSYLFQPLAIVVAVFTPTALTFASPSTPPNPAPQLIVWAHTDLENQGAPTLDILDLERYFVAHLERRIANVIPSQTARVSAPNAYLAELSVNSITPSIRGMKDDTGPYREDPVFHVELSLAVKDLKSGRALGSGRESRDYHLASAEIERLEPKRAALYQSADALADRFADGIAKGEFGEQLRSLQSSGMIPLATAVVLLAGAIAGVIALRMMTAPKEMSLNPTDEQIKRLDAAIALSIATDNFSQAKLWEAAHDGLEATLDRAQAIQEAEGARLATAKVRQAENAKIAKHAAATSNFSEDQILNILRQAEEWDYRLLREAQQQYERSVGDAAEAN